MLKFSFTEVKYSGMSYTMTKYQVGNLKKNMKRLTIIFRHPSWNYYSIPKSRLRKNNKHNNSLADPGDGPEGQGCPPDPQIWRP